MEHKRNQAWLKQIPIPIGHYLSGFADGEGSFNVSLRKRIDHNMGWQIVLTFNVAQRDKTVLALFKHHLGCGRLQERYDGVGYYVVTNYVSIEDRVIPFFDRFPFLSASKKKNFSIFRKISKLMAEGKHLTSDGMKEIVELRERLNEGKGRKRKYSIEDYQKTYQGSLLPTENPQRLYARPRSRPFKGVKR